jgi:hypothetical protein
VLPDVLYYHYLRLTLSTSAKYYSDIWNLFLEQITEVNSLLNIKKYKAEDCKLGYMQFYMSSIVSFVLYGLKMGKLKIQLIPRIENYYLFSLVPLGNLSLYEMLKVENKKLYLFWVLFKLKQFNLFVHFLSLKVLINKEKTILGD